MLALRYLDIVILILALPVFLAADLPMLGYAAAAVAWLAQRAIQIVLTRKAAAADDPRTVVGITAGSMIGRGWLVALTIFAAGMADNDAGLAAAVLVDRPLHGLLHRVHDHAPVRQARSSLPDGPSPPQRPPRVRPRAARPGRRRSR